jgi:hydroxymethylpyrimidine pyrophosphatase-like HAD family hydrolase
MKPIVFSDLDDTLFQTARKMTETPQDQLLASVATNGSHSYMTQAQAAQFAWLNDSTRLIPVTARSTEALTRCKLPFRDYRVASNGAVILAPDGAPDPLWMQRQQGISLEWGKMLGALDAYVSEKENTDAGLRHWIVMEMGLPIYFCVKSNIGEDRLDDIEVKLDNLVSGDLFKHRNGNNLAYMPHRTSKLAAVEYLVDKLGDARTPIWGMGDSMTDLPFMRACQMMVIPVGSQVDLKFK